ITQASVSQYLSSTRGGDSELENMFPEIGEYAKTIADRIASGEGTEVQVALLCEACSKMREEEKFCSYHRNLLELETCGICRSSSSSGKE
ncbi:MAG: hypothetical protein JSV09_11390, partial [Thermoplasmata archaeon]